jgi:hypothetical protein
MANSPTERAEQLGAWLTEAVALLLEQGGAVAAALMATCAGRAAVVRIDDTALRLRAVQEGSTLRLTTEAVTAAPIADFETDAATLRDIMDGQILLDTAIVRGRMRVIAPLGDLLAMHNLVLRALACGPLAPALRTLWRKFDATWPESRVPDDGADCSLANQRPRHGILQGSVPRDVLDVRLAGAPP